MGQITRWAAGAAAIGLTILATSAFAKERVRVRGTIEKVDGNVLTVKTREGQEVKVKLPDNARVVGIQKTSIDAFWMPSTRALSGSLILTSCPSRVLTVSTLPATCSIVPRTRTRSCAKALVVTMASPIAAARQAHRVI